MSGPLSGAPGDVITQPHAEDAVFEAMLDGWARQQRGTGRFQQSTLLFREQIVRRFAAFSGAYPWQWSREHFDLWIAQLTVELRRAESTVRGYQSALRIFCEPAIGTSPSSRSSTPGGCAARRRPGWT
ncbi:hypothetical protein [Nonomuraea basaltis]|uniref:hypothetical protein n=1 Tax=Nonomuraea basaltis TaxID=2495887 RepID=UPI001F10D787|nr:hypothetical protein [Nonomuraea basaltis]